jgi:hypothetical protein
VVHEEPVATNLVVTQQPRLSQRGKPVRRRGTRDSAPVHDGSDATVGLLEQGGLQFRVRATFGGCTSPLREVVLERSNRPDLPDRVPGGLFDPGEDVEQPRPPRAVSGDAKQQSVVVVLGLDDVSRQVGSGCRRSPASTSMSTLRIRPVRPLPSANG